MITLSQPQQELPIPGSNPVFQNWAPTTQSLNLLYNATLGLTPTPFSINFKIKDYVNTPIGELYSQLQLQCIAHHDTYPSFFDWLNVAGLPSVIAPTLINESNIIYSCNFTFNNLAILLNGNYSYKIIFIINGIDDLGNLVQLSSYEYTINLAVTSNTINFSPLSLEFNHIQTTVPLASKVITMYGTGWTLVASLFNNAGSHLNLSTLDSGVTFGSDMVNNEPIQFAQGSGTKNIIVTLDSFYDTANIPSVYLSGSLGVFAGTTLISGIPFQVNVYNPNMINVSPGQLSFSALKGIQEPIMQTLSVNIANAFTVSNSSWLTVTDVNGTYEVVPIPTENMTAGTYNGFVTFNSVLSGNPIEEIIDVTYVLQDFVVNPYADGRNAFTLDQDYFEFYSSNSNTYFQVTAKIRCFDFFQTTFKDYIIAQKIILFQGKEKTNLGQSIHRIMSRFSSPNNNSFQYLPAVLRLKVQEKLQSDDTLINEMTLPDIKYIAGIGISNEPGTFLLDFNLLPNSVKKSSYFYLNMILPIGYFALEIYKNEVFHSLINLPYSSGQVSMHKLSFEQFNQGDVIDVTLVGTSIISIAETYQKKRFYVIIPGAQSNFIEWENEFLLQSVINATGEYSIKADIEIQSNKIYQNLVERLEYISNTAAATLTINTGWLIQSDTDSIESLMRSKKVWITHGLEKVALRPVTKTLLKQDTQRELIEYTLEFTINKSSNEKTYSF